MKISLSHKTLVPKSIGISVVLVAIALSIWLPMNLLGFEAKLNAVIVHGTLVGDANASLTDAPLDGVMPVPGTPVHVPLQGPVAVVLVDKEGKVAASQVVDAADGSFALKVAPARSYMLLFREERDDGKTLAHLVVDAAAEQIAFVLSPDLRDVSLGAITLNSQLGTAWSDAMPKLAASNAEFALDDFEWRGAADIPTGGSPSPLFGAQSFTQQMVRFEEFGPEAMPDVAADTFMPLPRPMDARSSPPGRALDAFLAQEGTAPLPQRLANVGVESPWKPDIELHLGRLLMAPPAGGVAGPAEGRPSGEHWAHQQWEKLFPQQFFKTVQAGARVNGGVRDGRQRHGYALGEFAPGGLYHKVFAADMPGAPVLEGTTAGVAVRFHPNMPLQHPNTVWTFDGTLPPKLLQVRYGVPILMRHYNALPVDALANNGFGRHTISTHEHNGHQPAESDGFTGAFFFPGQFYDYRWPLQLDGFNTTNNPNPTNTSASDPRAAMPCEAGETFPILVDGEVAQRSCENGRINIPGGWRETMSSHWFHDHMFEHTAENVYKGNVTMMNYYSVLDRGNEAYDDGINLRFPSGTTLDWGNRDYDVNLLIANKAWDKQGQLWYNTANRDDGFLGDVMTVNFLFNPYFDVRARSYRFRILNGSVARIIALALVQEVKGDGGELPGPKGSGVSYNRVPFHMVANDGNIMEHAVPFDGRMDLMHDGKPYTWKGQLPSQGIGERYDIVVDFGKHGIQPGDRLYFVNTLEHQDGKGSKGQVRLGEILSGEYHPVVRDGRWINGDPSVGKLLEFRVHACPGGYCQDQSMNPAEFEPGKRKMIPLAINRDDPLDQARLASARHHTLDFVRSQAGDESHGAPWRIRVDGSDDLIADTRRVALIERGAVEVFKIKGNGGWTHPVHVHFNEAVILTRGGKTPPEWERWARKDMFRVGPERDSSGVVEIAYQARDFLGTFMLHCHNTLHEDHAMLVRWDAMGNATLADAPMPTWDGVLFEPSFALPLAEIGDGTGPVKGFGN
jgi:FtsP/CotA-like multicopper oxidase with cupredoxin domain